MQVLVKEQVERFKVLFKGKPKVSVHIGKTGWYTVRVMYKRGTTLNFKTMNKIAVEKFLKQIEKDRFIHFSKAMIRLVKFNNRFEYDVLFPFVYEDKPNWENFDCLVVDKGSEVIRQRIEDIEPVSNFMFDNRKIQIIFIKNLSKEEEEMCKILGNKLVREVFGSEDHGRPSFYLVYPEGLEWEQCGNFRCMKNVQLKKISSKVLILIPNPNTCVINLQPRWQGYRGYSNYECIEGCENIVNFTTYKEYRSPRGSTGVYEGWLVTVRKDGKLKFKNHASGRLYGDDADYYYKIENCQADRCNLDEDKIEEEIKNAWNLEDAKEELI